MSKNRIWLANQLHDDGGFTVDLGSRALEELEQHMGSVQIGLAWRPRRGLAPALEAKAQEIAKLLETGPGLARVRNLPIHRWSEAQARSAFFLLGSLVGTPVSQSLDGAAMMSVRDEGFRIEADQPQARGVNSRQALPFHTDLCDVIAFLCLKDAASGGDNRLVNAEAVFEHVERTRPELARALQRNFPHCRQGFELGTPVYEVPVVSRHLGVFSSFYLPLLIDRAQERDDVPRLDAAQIEALDYLRETSNDDRFFIAHRQEPGEALFLNNHVIYHARAEYVDSIDPQQMRHLLRLWLSPANSRELAPQYRANYRESRAGVPRGGIPPREEVVAYSTRAQMNH